jgi:hypothetical protein
VTILSADKLQSMSISDVHHLRSDIVSSGLRRIKQKSDLTGASTSESVAVNGVAEDSSCTNRLPILDDV